ncbi:MAG: hypothetical protein U9Q77_04350 [Candidatus Marinimicrobia bacterium]|nr:hypothetical protein [Candidatus Neomarinimicrobiota bacterium]
MNTSKYYNIGQYGKVIQIRKIIFIVALYSLTNLGFSASEPDTTKFDRETRGRPFSLEDFSQKPTPKKLKSNPDGVPAWVRSGELQSDTAYYGIGRSTISADEADDDARLRFAQYVEVSVQSIATQQIAENRDRLEENYNYESLVSTNMNLRSIKISERYLSKDSTFYSLIKYGKSEYHALVTQEIQISLETDIRKQELAHQAAEALSADSLRHKLMMDSLTLGRRQAVIDSLDHILKLEEARQRQEQDRIDLVKNQYSAFLKIIPRYQLIDVPSAVTPQSWFHISSRWNPDTQDIRQVKVGGSVSLVSIETSFWATESTIDQGDLSLKLQILPERGEIYPVSLALGWVGYLAAFSPDNLINLRESPTTDQIWEALNDELSDPSSQGSSFFLTATVGVPQVNNHISVYADKRKVSLAGIWYPFPRHMGEAISIINQIDYISADEYHNRFGDQFQWQFGLRLIAISNRFATMISYEDHEVWMLNFEFQY